MMMGCLRSRRARMRTGASSDTNTNSRIPSGTWLGGGAHPQLGLHHVDEVNTNCTALSLITSRFVNGNTVRNFPTHGQLSAAQGSPTTVSALTSV
jgi:hypothetical protein